MLLVQGADEVAHMRADNSLHGPFFRRDDMDVEFASAERRSDLEADKARAHDDGRSGLRGTLDNRTAVRK